MKDQYDFSKGAVGKFSTPGAVKTIVDKLGLPIDLDAGKYRKYVVHCKRTPYDVYIGRPARGLKGSKFHNPFVIGQDGDRAEVIRKYIEWLSRNSELLDAARAELRGKILGCWCAPNWCHGDILAALANSTGHAPDCDSLSLGPELGPSTKPCNCRRPPFATAR